VRRILLVLRALTTTRLWLRRAVAVLVPIAGLVFVSWAQTFFGAAVVAVPACSNSDAGGITPITGIVVLADTLTAGHGCGTGPGEIFKYVVVVQIPGDAGGQNLNNDFIAAGAYDCFTNGTFDNLCTYGSSASTSFSVSVFAFTAEQWTGALEDGEVTEAGAASGVVASAIATAPTSECSGGFLAPLELLSTLRATANWSTTCTATQQSNVPVIASCGPLQPAQP
jgi:hypothetical protein